MLNTYIKNRGTTKTIVHSNNHNHVNQTNWDVDYDGDVANISINTNTDGDQRQFNFTLDNEDLANILNVQSIDVPIDKRLKMDFEYPYYSPEKTFIELPPPPKMIEHKIPAATIPHISSPVTGEELIIPLTIDKKTIDNYTLTPKRRHRKAKTHVTHKVYKKPKTNSKTKSSIRKYHKSKPSTRKISSVLNLL